MFCFSIPSRSTLQVQNLISAQIITIIHFLSQHYINKEASTETLCTLYFVFPGWVSDNVIRQAACHKPNTLTSLLSVNVTWLIWSQSRERWKRTHFNHLNMICITCIWAWGGVGCDNQCECPPTLSWCTPWSLPAEQQCHQFINLFISVNNDHFVILWMKSNFF